MRQLLSCLSAILLTICSSDLGDDDFGGSNTTPFGRSNALGFGSGGGGAFGQASSGAFSSGLGFGPADDSPILMTPTADRNERSYFTSHSRGDSVTSVESTGSTSNRFAYPNRSQTSFASVSTTPTPSNGFTKKTSFASIRNAFKSGKNTEPPPLPSSDHVLKGTFNMSTSSLTSPYPSRSVSGVTSPPFGRPSTPSEGRFRTPKKGHAQAKSFHSQTGSIFHFSDGGSDGHGPPFSSSSPPPVPRVPNGLGDVLNGRDTPSLAEPEDDKVDMNPKTPSDFALHAVFMRFASSAEAKMDAFLRHALVRLLNFYGLLISLNSRYLGIRPTLARLHGAGDGSQI